MKNSIFALALMLAALLPATSKADASNDWQQMQAYRNMIRTRIRDKQLALPFIQPADNDQAQNLVDELKYTSLADMEAAGLKKSALPVRPWSDTYWPIYAGGIADRYNDSAYGVSLKWDVNERYLIDHLGRGPIAQLSPAEKYDLLVGDSSFTLAQEMIESGKPYFDEYKKVETWMGYCHGWAPASFTVDRPSRAITVLAADGRTQIEFYPADIRALATALWANGDFATRYIGGRCENANPPLDHSGRPTDPDCLDTNPATWHLVAVNQIGVAHRSFVADIDWSAQVWNQPAVSYDYVYQDFTSGKEVARLQDAMVPVSEQDPRHKVRSPDAKYLVRIGMNFTYGQERAPDASVIDNASRDISGRAHYEYTLELNDQGQIVGGEWVYNVHPDFLWVPVKGTHAVSVGDQALDTAHDQSRWDANQTVPAAWRKAAVDASAQGQPLARVVDQLVRWSN
jgi:Transglutaminase elicitor